MKIQTTIKGWFGTTIKLGQTDVEFNGQGVAEVKDTFGQESLAKYPGMIFKAGETPTKENKQEPIVATAAEVKSLIEEIEDLKIQKEQSAKLHADRIETLTIEVDSWKAEYEKAKELVDEVKREGVSENEYAFLEKIVDQNVGELREIALKLEIPGEALEKLKKPQLVVLIFKTMLNADKA